MTTWVLFTDLATWYENYTKEEAKKRPKAILPQVKDKATPIQDHKIPFSRSPPSRGARSRVILLSRALTEPSVPPLCRGTSNLDPIATIILAGQGHLQVRFGSRLR